ncbi:hypothetical protein TWF481_006395 [Arthrobotrys musiformis]|uniref:Uncharacterized protein n=1 Tax=Arthrobotrys musiformis TaxID=47236 RepID=A0AAV9WGJ3_9PEZI
MSEDVAQAENTPGLRRIEEVIGAVRAVDGRLQNIEDRRGRYTKSKLCCQSGYIMPRLYQKEMWAISEPPKPTPRPTTPPNKKPNKKLATQ